MFCQKVRTLLVPGRQFECEATGLQRAILRHFDKYYVRIPRTPVPHLFKTNGVPSAEDLVKMRAYIHQLQRIVLSTETSPSSIKRYKGNKAYGIATEHSRLLQQTTIRNLPPEIIQRIVYFSLAPAFVGKEYLPWVASWVCSSWRRTVLGHRHLWGILPKIDLRSPFFRPAKKEIIQELLRRSGDAPLSINIEEDVDFDHRNDSRSKPLLDLLLEHSHRYVDVTLRLHHSAISSAVLSTLPRWRQLRHLSINTYPKGPSELLPIDLRRMTSLRSIEVSGNIRTLVLLPQHTTVPIMHNMEGTNLSWEDWLRTLDFSSETRPPSMTKLVLPVCACRPHLGDDLVFAPWVAEVVLYDASPNPSWDGGPTALEGFLTPCLHTLKVSFASTFILEILASRLSPATLLTLTTLHLLHRPDSPVNPRSVSLSSSTSILTKLIDNMPNVVNLKISEDPASHYFIHLMAYLKRPRKDWDPYPLPRLKHLTIFVRWDIRPSVLDLLHYVAITRMERPPPFGDTQFDRLETLEVVLTGVGDTKEICSGRLLSSHATQDRVRGVMEGWIDSDGYGDSASHLSLVVAAEEMRDVRRRVARLAQSADELPLTVFADVERCLGKVLEGLGEDGPLSSGPIQSVYVRHCSIVPSLPGSDRAHDCYIDLWHLLCPARLESAPRMWMENVRFLRASSAIRPVGFENPG